MTNLSIRYISNRIKMYKECWNDLFERIVETAIHYGIETRTKNVLIALDNEQIKLLITEETCSTLYDTIPRPLKHNLRQSVNEDYKKIIIITTPNTHKYNEDRLSEKLSEIPLDMVTTTNGIVIDLTALDKNWFSDGTLTDKNIKDSIESMLY